MTKDSLGDRMKNYEGRSQTYLPLRTYTMIRLDGKAFHTYTKGCKRPFDLELMSDMNNTAKYLCENIQGCKLAYIQSDEITLVLTDFETINTDAWFNGNVQKITSISASLATAKFNQLRMVNNCVSNCVVNRPFMTQETIEAQKLAHFDSRCWVIPDPVEVHNCLVWRQQDATRNSIQMTGQAHFSHKQLQGKSCNEIQEMLWHKKNINWNDQPIGFKRGRCVIKETYETLDTYKNDGTMVMRSRWIIVDPPVFSQEPDWVWGFVPKL
jgi:tRNA(His) 5'-end guanylyltransferase